MIYELSVESNYKLLNLFNILLQYSHSQVGAKIIKNGSVPAAVRSK